ncbi:uncharacterized protein LAESUDRAFT_710302 [Laetiporus sulphureus 93-53]|uniref:Uncharacterized protein n=1 Tax=Laetiporus sulphureus 93-53 TaxID=1314785 RepID=A0A165IMI0_9APHY|nr:uncharacterized protein LAESUDRAFT_710302 [Laetiporus sulphureus 93-53]KZT13285.1 hypothetical protein LAESUDRAFT_710302 [Laetiporus sulphureus 93-53]
MTKSHNLKRCLKASGNLNLHDSVTTSRNLQRTTTQCRRHRMTASDWLLLFHREPARCNFSLNMIPLRIVHPVSAFEKSNRTTERAKSFRRQVNLVPACAHVINATPRCYIHEAPTGRNTTCIMRQLHIRGPYANIVHAIDAFCQYTLKKKGAKQLDIAPAHIPIKLVLAPSVATMREFSACNYIVGYVPGVKDDTAFVYRTDSEELAEHEFCAVKLFESVTFSEPNSNRDSLSVENSLKPA